MSRRRGEFEHRTSIFEGAFRAWSHLGGLDPEELETKTASELDPLTCPLEHDTRISGSKFKNSTIDSEGGGGPRKEFPYEPLPRAGLAHPYVQAILSPWLGPDADNEAIQLGLTTLRTWWQHRRRGESGSAMAALGTEKMKGVVEGYMRHFFTLAHCLIVSDKEQPPRTLYGKMKELEKIRAKRNKKRSRTDEEKNQDLSSSTGIVGNLTESITAAISADLTDSNLTPLERLHMAQRRQLVEANFQGINADGASSRLSDMQVINLKGKCIPGKIDLPEVVDAINRQATQLAYRGIGGSPHGAGSNPATVSSGGAEVNLNARYNDLYGDPNATPIVFVSGKGDIMIAMTVDGITCAHCVKIVETVLKGCNGNRSPIDGLLDAAADRVLNSILIKIDKASNAKRVAFESARNLSMVGYTAKAKEMSIVGQDADKKATMDLGQLSTAFEVIANTQAEDFFDWTIPCTCPDNGVLREDCSRHSQMNPRIFQAFVDRAEQVKEHMAGCGMKYGMDCTCGPGCRCHNCPIHSDEQKNPMAHTAPSIDEDDDVDPTGEWAFGDPTDIQPHLMESPLHNDQPLHLNFFGLERPLTNSDVMPSLITANSVNVEIPAAIAAAPLAAAEGSRAQRNPSVISYGNSGLRHMSITSETTFGRAMSGLSALSIDWENLDDFDIEVDHSAHIGNFSTATNGGNPGRLPAAVDAPILGGPRRSSIRRSILPPSERDRDDGHVSFKV